MHPILKFKKHDNIFLLLFLALIIVGTIFLYSASSKINQFHTSRYDQNVYLVNHIIRILFGILISLPFYCINYKTLKNIGPWIGIVTIIALLAARFINSGGHFTNTYRWLKIGPMNFQPSEFAKLSLILILAAYFEDFQNNLNKFTRGFIPVIIAIGLFVGLILIGRDLGSAIAVTMVAGIVVISGGTKLKHWGSAVISIIPLGVIAVIIEPYRIKRITSFISNTPLNEMHEQIRHSLVSLGNGGLFGAGLGNSIGKNQYLPTSYADFIFSIVGEEIGFIGAFLILSLFLVFFLRGIQISMWTEDIFGTLVCTGLIFSIFMYVILNVCVTCRLLPVTGLPLPFFSYGGTALMHNSIAVAIILNISSYKTNKTTIPETMVINSYEEE